MNKQPHLDDIPAADPTASHRLYQAGLAALVGAGGLFLWRNDSDSSPSFLLGYSILCLACLPALLWAKHRRPWFPAFEITLLSCAAFYAVPVLSEHRELAAYPPEIVARAAGLVVLYLAAANLAFLARINPPRAPAWATASLLPESTHRYLPVGMALTTIYLYLNIFTELFPFELAGVLRALFFGLGIICTFILGRLWGLQRLGTRDRAFFVFNLFAQAALLLVELYLIRAISLLALGLIAYTSARRRVPWLVLAFVLPVFALLHLGKAEMRNLYWEQQIPRPTLLEAPAFFAQWIDYSVESMGADNQAEDRSSLLERASLIQMLCLSVDRVPSLRPHLDGESYVDIPALFIPRFLWPDKPSSLLANIRLALHFDLVNPDDVFAVSIAFGTISEAYVNFGVLGPLLLGALTGLLFKRVSLLSVGAPQFSALGILMVLLTAWSFQAELVLATWLSSLIQAVIMCVGLPLLYRKLSTG